MHRSIPRAIGTLVAAAATTLLVAAPASAHVTVHSDEAEQGGYAKITFRVPNESEKAGTVKVAVRFGTEAPLGSVRTTPIPGWTSEITTKKLDKPVNIGDYDITEAVTKVTWTADKGVRVGPGEFQEFQISTGPLPSTVDRLSLPAIQTYDDGSVVKWDDPVKDGAAEPEHPAPTLTLAAPSGGHHGSQDTGGRTVEGVDDRQSGSGSATENGASAADTTEHVDWIARVLGAVGIAVSVICVIFAKVAIVNRRRKDTA